MAPLLSLPEALRGPVSRGTEMVRGTIGGLTWGPAVGFAKSAVLSILDRIEVGTLILIDGPGEMRYVFGEKLSNKLSDYDQITDSHLPRRADATPRAKILVRNESFWVRLLLFADMGFAEAYMLEDFECQDLTSFFQLFIVNRNHMNNGTTMFSSLASGISALARSTNPLSSAPLNISAHYDISNEMFAAFLSPEMTYSCPIWQQQCGDGPETEESLEEAQRRKLLQHIDSARIKSSDHVLEIGTGWGSFAIEAVKSTGCRVTSVTLSKEQKLFVDERIRSEGLEDRIEVEFMDYREIPVPEKPYDKIVSIEMLENVGQEYIATYFQCMSRLLKHDGGIAVFQCITMPEGRHKTYSGSEDFINHYIFPGGYLPSITELLNHITQQSKGTLIVEKVENIGGHYAKALRLWKENFLGNFDTKIKPALLREHPEMSKEGVEVFRRKWEYYFTYSEAGFITKTLGDVIITVGREGALELMEGIPI